MLAGSMLSLGAACGDDDGDDGAGNPDSAPVEDPDAGDTAFVEMPADYTWDDGGEIRLENVIFPDGSNWAVSTAHFISAQDGNMAFPNVAGQGSAYCNSFLDDPDTEEVEGDEVYPFGARTGMVGAQAAFAVPGRIYADIGPSMTLKADNADESFEWVKYEDYLVPLAGGLLHDLSYNPEPADYDGGDDLPYDDVDPALFGGYGANEGGTKVAITLAGGTDYLPEARTFDFETIEGNDFSGLLMAPRPNPANFPYYDTDAGEVVVPTEPLAVTYDEDLVITWDSQEGYNDAGMPGADLLTFAAIFQLTPTVEISHLCIQDTPGELTIPAEFVNNFPRNDDDLIFDGDDGWIFVSHLHHRLRTLDNERRIDVVGMVCTATRYEVSGEPL